MGIFDDDFEERKPPSSRKRVASMKRAHELPVHVPSTFEEALALLGDDERAFVKQFVKEPHSVRAYQAAFNCDKPTAQKFARRFLARIPVKAAIALGRKDVAQFVADSTKHDKQAAFSEIGEMMDYAMQTDNATAAVRAAELRARITGVLVDRSEVKQSGFQLVINESAPKGEVIDVEVVEEQKK